MVNLSCKKTRILWFKYSLYILLSIFSLPDIKAQVDYDMIYRTADGGNPDTWNLITDYPNLNIVKGVAGDPTIDGKYAFYPRYVVASRDFYPYTRSDGRTPSRSTSGTWTMNPGDWYVVHNVGKYKGQWIDMKVTYVKGDREGSNSTTTMNAYLPWGYDSSAAKENFLRFDAGTGTRQRAIIRYDFYLAGTFDKITATGTSVSLSGFWNLFRINHFKAVNIPDQSNIYVVNQTGTGTQTKWQLQYKDGMDNEYYQNDMYVVGTIGAYESSNTNITYTYEDVDHFHLIIQAQRSSTAYTKYYIKGLTKIEMPAPSYSGSDTYAPQAEYRIGQLIPPFPEDGTSLFYYTGYKMEADIPDVLKDANLRIVNTDGESMASYFTGGITGSTLSVSANATALTNENFYDQDIEFVISATLDKTKNFQQYIDGDYIKVPLEKNTVRTTVDGTKNHKGQNSDILRIYYPTPEATPIPQVYKQSQVPALSLLSTQAYLTACFKDIKDGAANNSFTLLNYPPSMYTPGFVGYAGELEIEIKSNYSELTEIRYVPVSIVDDNTEQEYPYLIVAFSFDDDKANVPSTSAAGTVIDPDRNMYLKSVSKVQAWNYETGQYHNDDLILYDPDNFITTANLSAKTYNFSYSLSFLPTLRKAFTGTITDSNITISGNARYCEGETVRLELTYDSQSTPEWKYPDGSIVSGLVNQDILIVDNAVNADHSGWFTVNIGSASAQVFVSVAPSEMYWSSSAVNYDWNNPNNWVLPNGNAANAVPSGCTNVTLPDAATYYPNLADAVNGTDYNNYLFGNAEVKNINTKGRAMIANTHLLTYENASVEIPFTASERNRWVMYSAPLRKVYSGDFMLLDAGNKPMNNPPAVYMSFFQTDHPDDWGPGTIAKEKAFTKTFGNVAVPLPLGKAFNVWIDADVDTNTPFRFPSIYQSYDYNVHGVWGMPMPGQTSTDLERREDLGNGNWGNNVSGRFITEDVVTAGDGTFKITPPDDNPLFSMIMVSNPYLAYLDMTEFLEANKDKLQQNYKIWSGKDDGFISFQYADMWEDRTWVVDNPVLNDFPAAGYVAPLQSFIVSKLAAVGNNTVELTYKPEIMTTTSSLAGEGGYALRSTFADTDPKGLLRIKAKFNAASNSTVLINTPGASNSTDKNDSKKLFSDESPDVLVYTISAERDPLAINVSGEFLENEIPIGLRLRGEGRLELSFTGINRFGYEVKLKDGNKEIEIAENEVYTTTVSDGNSDNDFYELNDRFSLVFPKEVLLETGIGEELYDNNIDVWSADSKIYIRSNEVIKSVEIYSNVGISVYSSADKQTSFTIEGLQPNQIYIAKILTSSGKEIKKVIVKQ